LPAKHAKTAKDKTKAKLEQISIKSETMAVGDNVGAGLVPAQ
jgi:hypothetical protein